MPWPSEVGVEVRQKHAITHHDRSRFCPRKFNVKCHQETHVKLAICCKNGLKCVPACGNCRKPCNNADSIICTWSRINFKLWHHQFWLLISIYLFNIITKINFRALKFRNTFLWDAKIKIFAQTAFFLFKIPEFDWRITQNPEGGFQRIFDMLFYKKAPIIWYQDFFSTYYFRVQP